MIDDPYKVLGVTPDTPPDEIKKAYRRLAKKYHPDLHPDDPECARRMNEINSAYDQINNPQKYQRQQPGYGGGYGSGAGTGGYTDPFGGAYGGYQRQYRTYTTYDSSGDSPEFQAAWRYIQTRSYQEALTVLNGVDARSRSARWYYLSGMANSGLGNKILALQQLQQAVRMEPNNLEYQLALQQVQMGGQFYQQQNADFCTMGAQNWCLYLCLLNLMCNCCCNCGGYTGGYGGYYMPH